MSVQWTKEQQKVIDLRDSNILVSQHASNSPSTLFCIGVNPVNPSIATTAFFKIRDFPIWLHNSSNSSSLVIYFSSR